MPSPNSPSRRDLATTKLKSFWKEWRGYALFLGLVWLPLRSSVIDYSPVPTGSMNPTILEGDVVYINKLAYGLRLPLTQVRLADWAEPQRGDIVVVLSPADETRLVKRIIGRPGDTIALRHNRLILNGEPVDYRPAVADFAPAVARQWRHQAIFADEQLGDQPHTVMGLPNRLGAPRDFGPVTVPADRYFLMGDSRDNSSDSRSFGFAQRDAILGRAEGVLVSLDINDTYLPRWNRCFTALR